MPPLRLPPRPLLAGVALACALATLGLIGLHHAPPAVPAVPADAAVTRQAAAPVAVTEQPLPSLPAPAEGLAAPERTKHPFAPGGDDIMNWEEQPAKGGPARQGEASARSLAETPWDVAGVETIAGRPGSASGAPVQALPLPDLSAFPIAAVADFFRDGRLSLFAVAPVGASQRATFLAADRQGRWTDRGASLLREEDRAACAQPRQALAADLNGDDRPDVYLVCGAEPPAACCRHQVFLSQPDGRYRRQDVAAAWETASDLRDVDEDGRLDVVGESTPPRVLFGRGDGSFAAEPSRYGRK